MKLLLSTLRASILQGHWGSDYYPTKCRGWLNNPRVTQIPGNLAYSLSIKYTENDPTPWHFFSWDSCYNNSKLFNLYTELVYKRFKFSAWNHFSSKSILLELPKALGEKLFDSLEEWGGTKSMKNLKGGEGARGQGSREERFTARNNIQLESNPRGATGGWCQSSLMKGFGFVREKDAV